MKPGASACERGEGLGAPVGAAAIAAEIRIRKEGLPTGSPSSVEVGKATMPFDLHYLATQFIRRGHVRGASDSQDNFAAAVTCARRAILCSERPRLSYFATLAHAAAHARDEKTVTETVEGMKLLWPDSAEADRWLGLFQFECGRIDECVATLEAARRLEPDRHTIEYELAFSLHKAGNDEIALSKAIELTRRLPESLKAWILATEIQLKLNRTDEAIATCKRIIARRGDSLASGMGSLFDSLGWALRRKNDWEGSRSAFQQAVRIRPNDADSLVGLGLAEHHLGQAKEARDALEKAVRLQPDHAMGNALLGQILLEENKLEEAEPALRCGISGSSDPRDRARLSYALGQLLQKRRLKGEAAQAYRNTILHNPDHPEAHCNLGQYLRGEGQFAEALELLRRGHELGTRSGAWKYDSASWVAACENDVREEQRLLRVGSRSESPTNVEDALKLAALAAKTSRFALATKLYQHAFREKPALMVDAEEDYLWIAAHVAMNAASPAPAVGDAETGMTPAAFAEVALAWLRADLAARERPVEQGGFKRARLQRYARRLLAEPAFSLVRDPRPDAAPALYSNEEWDLLWSRLHQLAQ